MKDLTPLYESIHGRLAEQLSTMRHVQDDELYAMIDAEIRDAEAREFLSVRENVKTEVLASWPFRGRWRLRSNLA